MSQNAKIAFNLLPDFSYKLQENLHHVTLSLYTRSSTSVKPGFHMVVTQSRKRAMETEADCKTISHNH